MATQQEAFCFEYLGSCEGSYGGKTYSWRKIDNANFALTWMLGRYSYSMKAAFEKYGKDLLKKYPGVFIGINGDLMNISDHELTPEPPIIEPPKPPVLITCTNCQGKGKVPAICPTCGHDTLEAMCQSCGGTGKVLQG